MLKTLYFVKTDRDRSHNSASYLTETFLVVDLATMSGVVKRGYPHAIYTGEYEFHPYYADVDWVKYLKKHDLCTMKLPADLVAWEQGSIPAVEAILSTHKHRRYYTKGPFELLCHRDMESMGELVKEWCGSRKSKRFELSRGEAARLISVLPTLTRAAESYVTAELERRVSDEREARRKARELELANERWQKGREEERKLEMERQHAIRERARARYSGGIMGRPSSTEPFEGRGRGTVVGTDDKAVEDSADPAFAHPDTRGFCSPDPASASAASGFLSPVYDTALLDDEPSKITSTAATIAEVKGPVVRRSAVNARSGKRDTPRGEAFRMFRERSLKEVDSPILRAGVGITAYSIAYMLMSRLLYGADTTSMPILGWVLVVCLSVMAGGMAAIKGFDRITGCQFRLGSV